MHKTTEEKIDSIKKFFIERNLELPLKFFNMLIQYLIMNSAVAFKITPIDNKTNTIDIIVNDVISYCETGTTDKKTIEREIKLFIELSDLCVITNVTIPHEEMSFQIIYDFICEIFICSPGDSQTYFTPKTVSIDGFVWGLRDILNDIVLLPEMFCKIELVKRLLTNIDNSAKTLNKPNVFNASIRTHTPNMYSVLISKIRETFTL